MINFFTKKTKPESKDYLKITENENALMIAINQEGQAIIRLSIQNLREEDIESFAKNLWAIQAGVYQEKIGELLEEIGNESDNIRSDFIDELIKIYNTYFAVFRKTSYNKEEKPVVSPLKFSSLILNNNGDK